MRKVFGFRFSVFSLAIMSICLPVSARVWTAGVAGSDDQFSVLLGMRPDANSRTEYRIDLAWYDGIREGTQEAVGLSAGIIYDVIKEAEIQLTFPFGMGQTSIKVDGYIGGDAGGVVNIHGPSKYDATVRGIIGLSVGDQTNRACLEVLPPVNKVLNWDNLGNLDDTSVIRLVFVHRFK